MRQLFLDAFELILDLDGKPIQFDGKDWTVGKVITDALIAPPVEGAAKESSMDKKLEKFLLATKIHKADFPVKISEDEAKLIKELVNLIFPSPLVVARIVSAFRLEEFSEELPKGNGDARLVS